MILWRASVRMGGGSPRLTMKPTDQDYAGLEARIARLEAQVARLSPATPPPGPVPTARTVPPAEPPPLSHVPPAPLQPVFAPEPPPLPAGDPARAIPSAVWIAGAGAVIFLIGVIYFLTVSIQRGWISPWTRVVGGVITGAALGFGATRLLRGPGRSLGVALLAAGLGTWTFAFYYGAQLAHLFPVAVGFGGAVGATLLAGALAARVRSDGAMAVGLATGLAAPLAFSSGRGSLTLLLVYLLLLTAAQLATVYLTRTGAGWWRSRLVGAGGGWLVFFMVAASGRIAWDANTQLALVALLGAAVLVLAWLPRHPEAPAWPDVMTLGNEVAVAVAGGYLWVHSGYADKSFSGWLLGLAAANLVLVRPVRSRSGDRRHDPLLLLLALAFALMSVAVALDREWMILVWSVMAAALAGMAWESGRAGRPMTGLLQGVAALTTSLTTIAWVLPAFSRNGDEALLLNRIFASGVLLALAWGLLSRTTGPLRILALVLLQFVAVNNAAWELARWQPALQVGVMTLPLGQLLATLVYALAGAVGWFRGVSGRGDREQAGTIRACGYGWLGWAALKLLFHDMAGTELLFRALAALGVGATFIAVALLANRRLLQAGGAEDRKV